MIAGQAFPVAEPGNRSTTVLAGVPVAGEEERVGDLTTELAGNMHESDQPYDTGSGNGQVLASEEPTPIHLDDLGLAVDNQPQGPPNRNEGQRLKRRVQCQATRMQQHMTQIPPHCANRRGLNEFVGILPSAVSYCKTIASGLTTRNDPAKSLC